MAVIGLDLGGTKIAAAVFSPQGEILHEDTTLLAGRVGPEVGALLSLQLRAEMDHAAARGATVDGIGVSVPGIFHHATRTVWAPNIPGWESYPLQAELEASVKPGVRVRLDSDRACSILGETWLGAAKGCTHAIFLAVGTGIGAGIMVDGVILRGSRDIAGAVGWMALDRPYCSSYRVCGPFEWPASGEGLVRFARQILAEQPALTGALRSKPPGILTTADVFAALEGGDPLAERVMDNAIELWGMAVANLVSVFDPEKIVVGGGVFGPAVRFLPRIRAEAERWAQPISMDKVEVVASALEGAAALCGAGRLALGSPAPAP